MRLINEQLAQYERDGYLVIDNLIEPSVVAELSRAYDELLERKIEAEGDRRLGGITRQIIMPSQAHHLFGSNAAIEAAREIAEQILGKPTERTFDMLIYKPPRHPHNTPWHQDLAYAGEPAAPAGSTGALDRLQFWVALDDVDVTNGCMHFIPGQHEEPLLTHMVASGAPTDPGRLLAIEHPERALDLSSAVAAPLRAGGCTVHNARTPHYTPPNRSSSRARRAYIFNLASRHASIEPE